MKKIILLITVVLAFALFSCSGKEIAGPESVPNVKPRELNIMYLDTDLKVTENRTDTIAMTIKDEPQSEGFVMISKKLEKTANSEYRAYITDENTGLLLTFFYKNKADFPYRITTLQNDVLASGHVTAHRKDTEDFDIIWTMDGEKESFSKIPLKNDIYSYDPAPNLTATENYQVKTIMTSVMTFSAINKYMENATPVNRGWFSKVWNFFVKVFAPIIVAIAVVVTVFFPPAAIVTTPLIFIFTTIATLPTINDNIKEPETTASKEKIINIKYAHAPNQVISDGDIYTFDDDKSRSATYKSVADGGVAPAHVIPPAKPAPKVEFDIEVPGANIESFVISMYIKDNTNPESYRTINSFFDIYMIDDKGVKHDSPIGKDFNVFPVQKFGNGYSILVERILEPDDGEEIYIVFKTIDEHVEVNGHVRKEIKIRLE